MYDWLHPFILQNYPTAVTVIDIQSYRSGYLPYPARVLLQTTTGDSVACVLKVAERADKVAYEAQVLRALGDLSLPVPKVLAGPVTVQNESGPFTILLVGELPGQPLPWLDLNDLAIAHRTCQLVHEAVDKLHALTSRVLEHPLAALIPSVTLEAELRTIHTRGGAWFDVPIFREALARVQANLATQSVPLVFSNGDYNPLNFLVSEDALVGWLDFENACFEDPYIGFAKFIFWADDTYGWGAGAKAGLVEKYLYKHHVPPATFLVRLALRGLYHLQDFPPADPPPYLLRVIRDAAQHLAEFENRETDIEPSTGSAPGTVLHSFPKLI